MPKSESYFKTKIKILLFLLFIPPIFGEILSGSTPPLEFINPLLLVIFTLLYGGGTLLIRELRARWKLQWGIIFLLIAYGIIEEGLIAQSFFNTGWEDLGELSGYGIYFGIQWSWTIMLTIFHGTISTLIPILITEISWPDYKYKPILGKKGLILFICGFVAVLLWGLIYIGSSKDYSDVYRPDTLTLFLTFILVIALILGAYFSRKTKMNLKNIYILPIFLLGLISFLFQGINLLLPNFMASQNIGAEITIIIQTLLFLLLITFMILEIFNKNVEKRHLISFVFGSILFWILFTPILEFNEGNKGILYIGILTLILLILWIVLMQKRLNKKG
jgi:hypothetical protein